MINIAVCDDDLEITMVILRKGMIMERRKIEIGERLRREREKAGYSQEAFAEILDCCAVTISRCW